MPNELYFIALIDVIHNKKKILPISMSNTENKAKDFVKRNKHFFKDKDWIIVKYDLSKWY